MATLGQTAQTLADLTKRLDPDGKIARIGEVLTKTNPILEHMTWKEGNLPTGNRTTVRTKKPTVGFRALNEGIPISKSRTTQFDDGAAMLEAFSQVDRKQAILSGDVGAYRLSEAVSFLEAMNDKMADTLFFGNANVNKKEFTGFATRYSDVSSDQVIDAGGTGSDNTSIYMIEWGDNVCGIYPKGTKAGLLHTDVTLNKDAADDGYPIGSRLEDGSGNPYMGYEDHYEWNCGLMIKDKRKVVRIANIDRSLLTEDKSTGAKLESLLVRAEERLEKPKNINIYCSRDIMTMLRLQMLEDKKTFLGWEQIGGKRVEMFQGYMLNRTDALSVDEARVI